MVITYQGENYFKLQSGNAVVLIDPENQRSFKGSSIIVNTIMPAAVQKPPATESEGEDTMVWIDHQGEYEARGIRVRGWSTGQTNDTEHTAYRINFDDITIGILGHLSKELDQKIQAEFNGIDILILPAGGKPFVSQTSAAKIVRQTEPGIVIPALYKDVKLFLKEFGKTAFETEDKLTIKKKDITPKAMRIFCLTS